MKVPVESPIGFADSELVAYSRGERELRAQLLAWNEAPLSVRFLDVIGVRDLAAGDLSDLCHETDDTDLLRASLKQHFDIVPADHGFKSFQFLDHDGMPALEVIAKRVLVSARGTEDAGP